jgi:hypothetical protein
MVRRKKWFRIKLQICVYNDWLLELIELQILF